jgi:hydrogenase expression/formation protein HypE
VSTEDSVGKISPAVMKDIIYPNLGARRGEILKGPAAGVDTCIVELGDGQVLVASTDPISLIPKLGVEDSAWMSVNLLVNDISTSGLPPKYLLVDLNLPESLSIDDLSRYWSALSSECSALGMSIVGGNTAKFEGCELTIVGSGTVLSTGPKTDVVSSSGAKLGDKVIVTKGAAISATGLLSRIFPSTVRKKLGRNAQEESSEYFRKIPVLRDATLAVSVGRGDNDISGMHDVAEGGVLAGMMELASASSLGMRIEKSAIPLSEETELVCKLFDVDPYWSLGEGALLITCDPQKAPRVVDKLREGGVEAAVVGEMVDTEEGVFLSGEGMKGQLVRPAEDPYWGAYYSGIEKKLE